MPWILWSSGGLSVLGAAFVILWIWLPRWAPEWVVKYSPWVDPVLRAMAGRVTASHPPVDLVGDFMARVETWGSSAHSSYSAGMESPDPRHRMISAGAFGVMRSSRSPLPDDAREKLCDLAFADDHLGVRKYAFFALRYEKSPRVSEVRAQGIMDREEHVRRAVVHGLDPRTSERDWQTLSSALSDPDGEVRRLAVGRVRDFGERRAVPRLLEMTREEKGDVILEVLRALAELQPTAAIPLLKRLLIDRQSNYHAEAIFRVLTQIDPTEGFNAKVESLRSDQMELRAYSAWELGTLGDPKAIAPLVAQLHDPEPLVVGYVINALVKLKATDAMEVVVERLEVTWRVLSELEEQRLGDPTSVTPMISGHFIRVHVKELLHDVAAMPLTPPLRERLARLRDDE